MHQIQFIHQPPPDSARNLRAFVASCAFHGLAMGLLLWLTFFYRSHLPPPSGSAPGAPSITLEAMVIASPPPEPVSPPAPAPDPPPLTPEVATLSTPQPPVPMSLPKFPEEGLPVLPPAPAKPTPLKTQAVISHTTTTTAQSPPKPAATAAASSYAPGRNLLPHPPYPIEARSRGETGTVIMNVQFDADGNVAQAEVAQSSGVALLDIETRSFIRAHWHSAEYAGQTISQPVHYTLENL